MYKWFRKVIDATDAPAPANILPLTSAQKSTITALFRRTRQNDLKVIAQASVKGYAVATGTTATNADVVRLAEVNRRCATTNVLVEFVPGPDCISFNRIMGFTGDRNKSVGKVKFLHTLDNIEVSCRALNLGMYSA